MSLYRDRGVVCRTIRLGEADKIVTLVTAERGKVRAVAKGVRRTKSRFGARLEPLTHVSLMCWQGRELDVVNQAEVIDTFKEVREDLERMTRATTMLEATDQVAQERHANPRLYQTLVGALRELAERDSPALLAAFLWKLLALEGAHPVLDACARCGSTSHLVAFDMDEGGALCRSCRRGAAVSPGAISMIRRILGGDLAAVLDEPASTTTAEVESLATEAVEHHLERRLRSVRGLGGLRSRA